MRCFKKLRKGGLLFGLLAAVSFVGGCGTFSGKTQKVADLDYVIVEERELPEELSAMMEERKAADFKMTYETEDALYIVHGYGEQETGGYSITVKECYLTENAIYFDTELIGPRKGEQVNKSPSYPYIVVRTEKREESVIFN